MKKILFIIAAAAMFACAASAQTYDYVLTKGNSVSSVKWVETAVDGGKTIDIRIGDKKFNQNVDASRKTTRWHYTYAKEGTDYEVTLSGGVYTIKGKLKGKDINKTEKSKGYAWLQNISYKGGVALKRKGETLTYECFRMDDASLNTMQVTNIGQETVNGKTANHLKITPTGVKAKLWSCHEYCNPETGVMVSYRAVEGVPGTPETVWTIKD